MSDIQPRSADQPAWSTPHVSESLMEILADGEVHRTRRPRRRFGTMSVLSGLAGSTEALDAPDERATEYEIDLVVARVRQGLGRRCGLNAFSSAIDQMLGR